MPRPEPPPPGGATGAAPPAHDLMADHRPLLRCVELQTGLAFSGHRLPLVLTDLERLREQRRSTPAGLLQAFLRGGAEAREILSTLTVGETYFFREPDQLELLHRVLIPRRLAAQPDLPVRIWSAGCASGEEPYSVAIQVDEDGLGPRVVLLASDLDEAALARARQGLYRDWSFRGLPPHRREAYFTPEGARYRLEARIREQVTFFPLNLVAADTSPMRAALWNMDVILCRNVLLHLSEAGVGAAFHTLATALAPDGRLLLGASDPPPPPGVPLVLDAALPGLVYRRVDAPAAPVPAPTSVVAPSPAPAPARDPIAHGQATRRLEELARERGPEAALLRAGDPAYEDQDDPEVLYMQAILQLELDRPAAAEVALEAALLRAPGLAVLHFVLGMARERQGRRAAAHRAFLAAQALLLERPPEAPLALGQGERVAGLLAATEAALHRLGGGLR
jgi:chemotaxis protein methyltransferase CheR